MLLSKLINQFCKSNAAAGPATNIKNTNVITTLTNRFTISLRMKRQIIGVAFRNHRRGLSSEEMTGVVAMVVGRRWYVCRDLGCVEWTNVRAGATNVGPGTTNVSAVPASNNSPRAVISPSATRRSSTSIAG